MSKVENVVCGSFNTIAVTTDSKIFAWGKNSHGMLGIPHLQDQNILIPQEVLYQKDDPSLIVSEIALGSMHQLILCTNGQLYSCGNSVEGVLGVEGVIDKVVAPDSVPDMVHRVYFFQKEADTQAKILKRKVFHDMDKLKLSEKFHLRYFALHIEELSQEALKVADQLSVMSIRRII